MKKLVLVALLLAAGCGGDDDGPASPAQVTPVPTSQAPVPTPEHEIHDDDEGGDEAGINVPVAVDVSAGDIRIEPDAVAAFLPLRLKVRNTTDRRVTLVVRHRLRRVARVRLAPGATKSARIPGLEPGPVRFTAGEAMGLLGVTPGGG